jgi:DNA helicase II / ATP-dependent DNA helicase PcrA
LNEINKNGSGEVIITQLTSPEKEAEWIATKVEQLLAKNIHPSEIIILVQRRKAGRRILNALNDEKVPSKSYYDESQLDGESAQRWFALLNCY